MNGILTVASELCALVGATPLARLEVPSGEGATSAPDGDGTRTDRIREVAYRLYEARGRSDGHELDDWLAAEAALSGESAASAPQAGGSVGDGRGAGATPVA